MLRNFKLTVAYDGTDYVGWQIQPNQPTIQGKMQAAMKRITKQHVLVVGSGRTDSGVHALAQVANCLIEGWPADGAALVRGLNTLLPDSIVVIDAVEVPEDFHAIRDAMGKRYRYQIQLGGIRDAFEHRYHWRIKYDLDVELMRQATTYFLGEQDFASFQAAGSVRLTTVRNIRACDLLMDPPASDGTPRISIEVEANGFLYNMVRNIVGTLFEVGRGKYPPDWVQDLIAERCRDAAGQTAPAQGLFLMRVDYPPLDSLLPNSLPTRPSAE